VFCIAAGAVTLAPTPSVRLRHGVSLVFCIAAGAAALLAADRLVLGACCALRVGVIRAGSRFVTFLRGS